MSARVEPLARSLRFVVSGRQAAIQLLARPHSFTHLVSIGDSTREAPVPGSSTVRFTLARFFDDVSFPHPGYTPPSEDDVRAILRFARLTMTHHPDPFVLFHCEQGISRSTAAAFIVLAYLTGRNRSALAEVLRAVPHASPNARMVELADQIMHRNGLMVRALRWPVERTG